MNPTVPGPDLPASVEVAMAAYAHGWQPVPVREKLKRVAIADWTRLSHDSAVDLQVDFERWATEGHTNVGVLLGAASHGLVDIDIDHPRAARLRDHFLPPTPMRSGRASRPYSHYWYIAEPGTLRPSRRYKMVDRSTSIEYRADGMHTVLPGSVHPSGEDYVWSGTPWGGDEGPARVDGRILALQVALIGLSAILIDAWPEEGGRHDAYLALAGGLLRQGDGVHAWWESNAPVLIRALADATGDEDGARTRESEVMGSTLRRLRAGRPAQGFGTLAELLGSEVVDLVRRQVDEVESIAGLPSRAAGVAAATPPAAEAFAVDLTPEEQRIARAEEVAATPLEDRDPLAERVGTWQPVDLEPFLTGRIAPVEPTILRRSDGQALLYPGRLNMLYGSSESAKSWIALWTCLQEIGKGERVAYLDLEDEPVSTLSRLAALGAGHDDLRLQFAYFRPEEPLAPMQRNRFGATAQTDTGVLNATVFEEALAASDPSLIVVDGVTVLYGLHGLDANDAVSTDVITSWLKRLTRNGRTTVLIIDHTTKNAERGTMPLGSQHKVAMIQGAMLQVWPVQQPMPGARGEVELIVLKDRPGLVRRASSKTDSNSKAQVSAVLTIDSRTEGVTSMHLDPPRTPTVTPTAATIDLSASRDAAKRDAQRRLDQRVLRAFSGELGRQLAISDIYLKVLGPPNTPIHTENHERAVRQSVGRLRSDGWLRATGATKGRRYELVVASLAFEDLDDPVPGTLADHVAAPETPLDDAPNP